MEVHEREPGDVEELERPAAAERDALRRDRHGAIVMALDGGGPPPPTGLSSTGPKSCREKPFCSLIAAGGSPRVPGPNPGAPARGYQGVRGFCPSTLRSA